MAEVILMPRLSDTMTEGVIAAWHKKVGDAVKKGDLLAEIETDKATMELESYQNGTVLHLGIDKGGKLQVNDLLCIIGNAGEDISALISGANNTNVNTEEKIVEVNETASQETTKSQASEVVGKTNAVDIASLEEAVLMPRLSDTMTEGVIASWTKNVGDAVKKGDVLADIETDKATMELESYKDGILLYQGAAAGEKIQVNDLLCIIGKADTNVNTILDAIKNGGTTTAASTTDTSAKVNEDSSASLSNMDDSPLLEFSSCETEVVPVLPEIDAFPDFYYMEDLPQYAIVLGAQDRKISCLGISQTYRSMRSQQDSCEILYFKLLRYLKQPEYTQKCKSDRRFA